VLRRGFVDAVTMRAAEVAERFAAIVQLEPVRRLSVLDRDLSVISASSAGPCIRVLDVSGVQLGARWRASAFSGSTFTSLEALELANCQLGPRGAAVIAEAANPAHLPKLVSLKLANNGLGDAGASAVASAPVVSILRELHLGSNRIGLAGARALAASEHLGRISA